jgi:hypothetical protein
MWPQFHRKVCRIGVTAVFAEKIHDPGGAAQVTTLSRKANGTLILINVSERARRRCRRSADRALDCRPLPPHRKPGHTAED